jgi:hypothetical protein
MAGGEAKSDLHVSFRRDDGTWEDFVRLDDTINTPNHEWCPMVTPDGKYLSFSRRFGEYDTEGWEGTTDGEVYWVDVRALDKHRPANADERSLEQGAPRRSVAAVPPTLESWYVEGYPLLDGNSLNCGGNRCSAPSTTSW